MGPVVLGKLYPDVTMVQSAEDRQRQNATYRLDRMALACASNRGVEQRNHALARQTV